MTKYLKLLLIFLSLSPSNYLFAQGKSPVVDKSKILTLSNGRYDEFMENDSIRRIGSVLVNMRTQKIIAFLDIDSLRGKSVIESEKLSRHWSIDPLASRFPFQSPYSALANNPIVYIDPNGDAPKVAIIIQEGANDFRQHKAALEKEGYVVLKAATGRDALALMGQYSPAESPIESLILLSHGSPGGISNGGGGAGIYTDMELDGVAKGAWTNNVYTYDNYLKSKGIITDQSDPNYSEDKYGSETDNYFGSIDEAWKGSKGEYTAKYKETSGAITADDIENKILGGEVHVKNLGVVVGGCNLAGYTKKDEPNDKQDIFTSVLATTLKATVYGSQGYTSPAPLDKTTPSRSSTGTWVKTDSNGTKTDLGKKNLDLGNPDSK
jgi:hypothetical protein